MGAAAALRVGIIDASYDSIPLILHEVQARYPGLGSCYPWSVLWHKATPSGHMRAIITCAQAMSQRLGWLATAGHTAN